MAYELGSVTAGSIDFTSVASTTAYQPYLVHNNTDAPVTLTIDAVAGNLEFNRGVNERRKTVENIDFIGNFQQFQVTGSEGYAAFRSNGQMAWMSNAGTTVGSLRAYLAGVTTEQMAQAVTLDGIAIEVTDDVVDALHGIIAPQSNDAPVYTIHGQLVRDSRVDRTLPKGIYIQNGRKFVVR